MSNALVRGLYELLVTHRLVSELERLEDRLTPTTEPLRDAEAANRIALHLAKIIERALDGVAERDRAKRGIDIARELLELLGRHLPAATAADDAPSPMASVLRGVFERHPDGSIAALESPLIPLLDTTLLTNAPGEPRVGRQIQAEIASADRIDALIAFIRSSGLAPLRETLDAHRTRGRALRVLTTTYTGSTERRALDQLQQLGATIRVSYDTSSTRLHAKAWLFHRDTGFSTAYIGSSNLTHTAQLSGLEWNVRVSAARNPDVIAKVGAVFESYWENPDFRPYDPEEFDARTERAGSETRFQVSPIEVRPEPFQERLLEQIAVARRQGHHRNLLVAATGTGKTVMAALDYARLRSTLSRSRLLFVAHRQEILEQSQAIFRHALREPTFGEPWVGRHRPRHFEHVFASIQGLQRADLADMAPDHFDIVIVDEFHHAAARSYERLLGHVAPRELLGLTATPERADGLPILQWFDGRIAAELRLWDAIDQHYLTPFHYFGIHDGADLTQVPWRRGMGYDVDGLTNLYTASEVWARVVIKELTERVPDPSHMRALGFCVGVEHARFMARVFNEARIPSVAVWGASSEEEREAALRNLRDGAVRVVFSVDLFNEGIDVPAVDTLLLLRPSDSPTLFLQQLGRGLRRAQDKSVCTVLDFVGQHRKEFRFDRRLRVLLGGTRRDIERQVEARFPFLPAGCHMELDRVATEIVLHSIREALPSRWPEKVAELSSLAARGEVDLATYLDETGCELEDVYTGSYSWSDLCEQAGVPVAPRGPREPELRRACGRLLHVDDEMRLDQFAQFVASDQPPVLAQLDECQRRMLRMLVASMVPRTIAKGMTLEDGAALLWSHLQVLAELRQLVPVLRSRIDHAHTVLDEHRNVPLQVHARYTRVEILAAFDEGEGARVVPWQTGVRWLEHPRVDLFAFTLDKTDGSFSPTTRYRDYAISSELIHWESQSVTRAESETGLRYQRHAELGTGVMLFARLRQRDRAFWFLGPATYVKHTGERPMAVVWRLKHPLPGDLFAAFAAAVA